MNGAELKIPYEPEVLTSDRPKAKARKEIAEKVIDLFKEDGLTFSQCYQALEDSNQILLYRSTYVHL